MAHNNGTHVQYNTLLKQNETSRSVQYTSLDTQYVRRIKCSLPTVFQLTNLTPNSGTMPRDKFPKVETLYIPDFRRCKKFRDICSGTSRRNIHGACIHVQLRTICKTKIVWFNFVKGDLIYYGVGHEDDEKMNFTESKEYCHNTHYLE